MDKLIADAIREKDNFTTKEVTVSTAKLDSKGMKVLVSKTSKNGKKYEVVDREVSKKTVQVDAPSRQQERTLLTGSERATMLKVTQLTR